jgi:hypothetical protein
MAKRVKAPGVMRKLKRAFTGKSGVGNAKKKGLPKKKKPGVAKRVGSATADHLMGKKKPLKAKRVRAKK